MKWTTAAVATAARIDRRRAPAPATEDLTALRRRLAPGTTQDAVLTDFLEDDLRELRRALAALGTWLDDVQRTVRDGRATQDALLALAGADEPLADAAYAEATLVALRRRLGRVAVRLPAGGAPQRRARDRG